MSAISAEALSKLLSILYAAPAQPELWTRFLEEFTRLVGLPAAAILHQDLAHERYGFNVAVGVDPAAQSLYERHYGPMDVWRPNFLAKREGELALGEELYPHKELVKTDYYNEFLTRFDIRLHAAVATVKQPTRFENVSLYRGLDAADPPPESLAAIELVVPHLRTALQLRHRLCESEQLRRNHADVIESLRAGVVILNERGDCVVVNRRATQLCAADNGISISQSRLCAHHPDDHALLCGLIGRANAVATGQSTKPCGTAVVRRRGAPPLQVSAVALSPRAPLLELTAAQVATVAVFLRAPDDELNSLPELLTASYGLTSAEARLGALLFDGCSLTQAAERNNVSRETVRVQLRSIFSKTHVRRQADFLRLCWLLVGAP